MFLVPYPRPKNQNFGGELRHLWIYFLPGESQRRGSLVGYHLWGRTESDTTEATQQQQHFHQLLTEIRALQARMVFQGSLYCDSLRSCGLSSGSGTKRIPVGDSRTTQGEHRVLQTTMPEEIIIWEGDRLFLELTKEGEARRNLSSQPPLGMLCPAGPMGHLCSTCPCVPSPSVAQDTEKLFIYL